MEKQPPNGLPMFYRSAVPLNAKAHAKWRLLPGDASFAASAHAAPVTVGEFCLASASYPILFTADDPAPVVLMGLEQRNLFVTDGQWENGAYVPAYVRRYPFILIAAGDKSGFALGIDESSPQVAQSGKTGEALFDKDQPGAVTQRALEFCRLFNEDYVRTRLFCQALVEADLLVERRVDAALSGGRKLGIAGFKVVDAEKFARLDEAHLGEWHRRGWLALVNYHLGSLVRFDALLALQNRAAATQPSHPADTSPAEPVTTA